MLDDFCWLDWNTIDLLVIKEIICNFQISSEKNILHKESITLDSVAIAKIFKLPMEGIVVLARESYNKEWVEYLDGEKDEHYK